MIKFYWFDPRWWLYKFTFHKIKLDHDNFLVDADGVWIEIRNKALQLQRDLPRVYIGENSYGDENRRVSEGDLREHGWHSFGNYWWKIYNFD